MKKLTIVLFTIEHLPVRYAQSNYRMGDVVKSNGDTVKGYINYRTWNKSPNTIQFKSFLDSNPVVFNPVFIKAFKAK